MSLDRLTAALADRYRIIGALGAGGMATVYRAEDLKHHRQVAVKVLSPDLAHSLGSERFLREIATTANLRHPHILPLFDSGVVEGPDKILYYVMPLVEGESLRDRLDREKRLPIDDALAIAREVGDALAYAHQRNVIHRDIKPQNILLEGSHAVVADFGIARVIGNAGGEALTGTGVSIGTPLYMSPEQAVGDHGIDARSDQYALGCVLYEMLAGQPPFTGPTAASIVGRHMASEAEPVTNFRPGLPATTAKALARSMAKNPADRFSSTAEFVEALTTPSSEPVAKSAVTTAKTDGKWMRLVIAGAVVGLVAIAGVWVARLAPKPLHMTLGHTEQLTAEPGVEIQPALSPDGKLVAFAQGTPNSMRIFIRPLGGGRTIPLSDDSTSVETHPAWSPDGNYLAFLTRYGVSISPALGGSSRVVVPPPRNLTGTASILGATTVTWSPTGEEIAFARADSLFIVSAKGDNTPRSVASGMEELHSCSWSPNGKWIVCVSGNVESTFPGQGFGNLSPSAVVLIAADGSSHSTLIPSVVSNQSPMWAGDSEHLLFVSTRDGPRDIYSLGLSESGKPVGTPDRVSTGLGTLSVSLSGDGSKLAYTVYSADANLWSWSLATGATVDPKLATRLTSSHQVIEWPSVSRDGRWLLFDSNLSGNADIYRVPAGGGSVEQLTRDSADEFGPDLSPDGKEVAYHVWRNGTRDIAVRPLDGGAEQIVAGSPTQESFPVWSPDGNELLYWDQTGPAPAFIVTRRANGTWGKPVHLTDNALFPTWSPDGQEIAYSTELPARKPELMAIRSSGGTPRRLFQPGPDGPWAEKAIYSPDGATVYFKSHDAQHRTIFYSVPAAGGTPRGVARLDDPSWQSIRPFFATDGKRLFFPVEDRQSDIYVADVVH